MRRHRNGHTNCFVNQIKHRINRENEMPIPANYQKMYRNGDYIIAELYRAPEFKELMLVGWLDTDFEVPLVEQKVGESFRDFMGRVRRESVVTKKVARVRLETARDGGVMSRINGKASFPARNFPIPVEAKSHQLWELEVVGENKSGNVYFFRFLSHIPDLA